MCDVPGVEAGHALAPIACLWSVPALTVTILNSGTPRKAVRHLTGTAASTVSARASTATTTVSAAAAPPGNSATPNATNAAPPSSKGGDGGLPLLSTAAANLFQIERGDAACHTPRRNKQVEAALDFTVRLVSAQPPSVSASLSLSLRTVWSVHITLFLTNAPPQQKKCRAGRHVPTTTK